MMDQNNPTMSAPQGEQVPEQGGEKSMGALIGAIIVIVVLVIGGLFLWSNKMKGGGKMMQEEQPEAMMESPDTATEMLKSQGASDELSSIEQDLLATPVDGLDADL